MRVRVPVSPDLRATIEQFLRDLRRDLAKAPDSDAKEHVLADANGIEGELALAKPRPSSLRARLAGMGEVDRQARGISGAAATSRAGTTCAPGWEAQRQRARQWAVASSPRAIEWPRALVTSPQSANRVWCAARIGVARQPRV
jgi:hypothetical protein